MVVPVLILSYNAVKLLHRCIVSIQSQDVETKLFVIENGSSDGSGEYLQAMGINRFVSKVNLGVTQGWNIGLNKLFGEGHSHICVLNQDTALPPYFIRELLAFDVPLVTGYPVETEEEIGPATMGKEEERRNAGLTPHPCFSAFLLSRDCWDTVGEFDPAMMNWASDCDYHVRGHRFGVGMWNSMVPFWHHAGTTLRTSTGATKERMTQRANLDRAEFKKKWGCEPGEPAYDDLFAPENFGIDRVHETM